MAGFNLCTNTLSNNGFKLLTDFKKDIFVFVLVVHLQVLRYICYFFMEQRRISTHPYAGNACTGETLFSQPNTSTSYRSTHPHSCSFNFIIIFDSLECPNYER